MLQAARFLDKHPGFSFSLLYDAAWGEPLDTGILPARDAVYGPTGLLNEIDCGVVLTGVPSALSRFGLLWQREPQTVALLGLRQVSGGYL